MFMFLLSVNICELINAKTYVKCWNTYIQFFVYKFKNKKKSKKLINGFNINFKQKIIFYKYNV